MSINEIREITTIQISTKLRDKLIELKLVDREPYESVIKRILNSNKKEKKVE